MQQSSVSWQSQPPCETHFTGSAIHSRSSISCACWPTSVSMAWHPNTSLSCSLCFMIWICLSLSLSLTLDPCWRLCWQLWFFKSLHAPLWQFFIWHNWNGCYCYYYYYFMIQVVFIPGVKNKQLKKISPAATGPDLRQWNRRNRWSVLSWNAGCHTLGFANIITIYYYY